MTVRKSDDAVFIRGPRRDILRFFTHLLERNRRIRRSYDTIPIEGNVTLLAEELHPRLQELKVSDVTKLTDETFLYRLIPVNGKVAVFRSGSYISVDVTGDKGELVSRPYSICNSPSDSLDTNSYEICVGTNDIGFVSELIIRNWAIGSAVRTSAPQGFFTYERLRDGDRILLMAGGTGVTPFRSIIPDVLENFPTTSITLMQGAGSDEDLFFSGDFESLSSKYGIQFTYVPVISGTTESSHRTGFMDAVLIDELVGGENASIFICGPPAMHTFLNEEIPRLSLHPRRVRREDYGGSGNPSAVKKVTITVHMNNKEFCIPADPGESILVALERAGLEPPSGCRNGTCGFCRSRLSEGKVIYNWDHEGLRAADRELGFIHPCVAKPASDMKIEIPEKTS